MPPDPRVLGVVAAAALVASLAIGALPALPLSNDGPQILFAAAALENDDLREPWFDRARSSSNHGPLELTRLGLKLGLRPDDALSAAGLAVAALWALAFTALVLCRERRRAPLVFLGFSAMFGWSFEVGLWSFQVACSIGLIAIAVGAFRPPNARNAALASLLLFAACFAHVVAAALAGAIIVALRVGRPGWRPALFAQLLPAATCLWMLLPPAVEEGAGLGRALGLSVLLDGFVPGPVWRSAPLLAVAVVAVVATAAGLSRGRAVDRAAAIVGLLCLIAATLAPDPLLGWQLFPQRLLPFAFALLLSGVPLERVGPRVNVGIAAVALLFSFCSTIEHTIYAERLAQEWTPVVKALRQAPKQTTRSWMPVVAVSPGTTRRRGLEPWLHIGQLIAVDVGGAPGFTQDARPTVHHIRRRRPHPWPAPPSPGRWPDLWSSPPAERARLLTAYAAWGLTVDGLLVYGADGDDEALRAGGQRIDASFAVDDAVVFVTTSVGCRLHLTLTGPADDDGFVEVGFWPAVEPLDVIPTPAGDVAGDVVVDVVVDVDHAPCGPVWIKRSPQPCAGAAPDGRLSAFVVDGSELACERVR